MASKTVFYIGWIIILSALTVRVDAGETPAVPPESGETVAAEDDTLTAATEGDDAPAAILRFVNQPWKGDLDGMLKRGLIRVLVVNSKTMYF